MSLLQLLSVLRLFFRNIILIFMIFTNFISHLNIFVTLLKWVIDCLVYHPFSKLYKNDFPVIGEELSIGRCVFWPGCDEETECAMCLCRIGEGEEVKELRCSHLFHRACLDRWVDYKHATCPLCRGFIAQKTAIDELGDVLLFKFCFSSSNNRENWWLR
ncbi:RING-H2 zinc finger protein RHA2b [Quillaja saponaria]|uniref:RING-H2 zinc finger protein RHA2b n=1 Tax=Quillaja saponaria TaxID=32244 RepID=A0AAD7L9D4_QUISA|nr:RING-H2 zinc finger protein RHA2b [Quillaja saponaria]